MARKVQGPRPGHSVRHTDVGNKKEAENVITGRQRKAEADFCFSGFLAFLFQTWEDGMIPGVLTELGRGAGSAAQAEGLAGAEIIQPGQDQEGRACGTGTVGT